jgi:hypothetical protein
MTKYNKLQQFRLDTYQMLVKARDATFELEDIKIVVHQLIHQLLDKDIVRLHGYQN